MADTASAALEVRDREIKVFAPPTNAAPKAELPESFYKLTPNEVKALYNSQLERRQKLENAQTQKMRAAEELERMKRYPKTTIRVRLPDSVILQATFQSKEIVAELYDFVRSTLRTPERKFLLCLPPRSKLTDPTLTLYKAGLAPASNIMLVWIEKSDSKENEFPVLTDDYINIKQPLSMPSTPESNLSESPNASSPAKSNQGSGSKSNNIPKWLQKGLFKK
ncbi:UBX domain-containing protein 6 [Apophysomyces ossiformis]|uniref:UBX domain-containing protein 6 n=1 Tax=Apophysomyces ossiformis TaxID=679940 RepID=A0A8H7BFP3_9FUNG|nr:UBX domain-containing protein 6 [Apophysomyces ossiformis]